MVIFDSFLDLLDCFDTRELFFKVYYYQLTLQKIWEENYTLYCVKNPETDLNQDEYTLNRSSLFSPRLFSPGTLLCR